MFLIQLCKFWSPELQQVMSVHDGWNQVKQHSYPPLGGTRGRAENAAFTLFVQSRTIW